MTAHMANHLGPAQASGQHQVADKHANIRRRRQHAQRLLAVFRFERQVAKLVQLLAQGLTDIGFIFQHQYQPLAIDGGGGRERFIFRNYG